MEIMASSAICRALVFVLKKAKWLKEAEFLLTKTSRLVSSCSNSMVQATSFIPTKAAWLRVYASNSSGDLEPSGFAARFSNPLF